MCEVGGEMIVTCKECGLVLNSVCPICENWIREGFDDWYCSDSCYENKEVENEERD